MLDIGVDGTGKTITEREKECLPQVYNLTSDSILFVNCSVSENIHLYLGKNRFPGTELPILTTRLWEKLSIFVVSTNVSCLGATYDVTSGYKCNCKFSFYFVKIIYSLFFKNIFICV